MVSFKKPEVELWVLNVSGGALACEDGLPLVVTILCEDGLLLVANTCFRRQLAVSSKHLLVVVNTCLRRRPAVSNKHWVAQGLRRRLAVSSKH
jgi:hypothetical protein